MLWKELLSCEFKKAVEESRGVCAIPIGCVEKHGDHLPLGCDTIWGAEFTRRAAEIEPVVVFPELYFGEKSGAGEYPGTIIFPTSLIWKILEHSCFEIARNGFRKIVLMNSHGGNTGMLQAFARQLLQKKPNFQVFTFDFGLPKKHELEEMIANCKNLPYSTEEDIAVLQSYVDQGKGGGRGDFKETACCYDACPTLCRLENMEKVDGNSIHRLSGFAERSLYSPFTWMANFPNSLNGDYHAGMNERIARLFGEFQTKKAADAFQFLKEETMSDKYHAEWLAKQ